MEAHRRIVVALAALVVTTATAALLFAITKPSGETGQSDIQAGPSRTVSHPDWSRYRDPASRYEVGVPPGWGYVVVGEALTLAPEKDLVGVQSAADEFGEVMLPAGITISHSSPSEPTPGLPDQFTTTRTEKVTVSGLPATRYRVEYLQDIGFAKRGDVENIVVIDDRDAQWVVRSDNPAAQTFLDSVLSTLKIN